MKYRFPSETYMEKMNDEFIELLSKFINFFSFPKDKIHFEKNVLFDTIQRVHQEEAYYMYFYEKRLYQSRKAAFSVYWILRYHPITANDWDKDFDVNVYFAFFILLSGIFGELMGNDSVSISIRNAFVSDIVDKYSQLYIRAFSEYTIGKEALILLSETLKSHIKCLIELNENKVKANNNLVLLNN